MCLKNFPLIAFAATCLLSCNTAPTRFGNSLPSDFPLVRNSFTLKHCPEDQFDILKRTITRGDWTARADNEYGGPYCHGFVTYSFEKKGAESEHFQIVPVYAHVEYSESGKQCFLQVAVPDPANCGPPERSECRSLQSPEIALSTLARLIVEEWTSAGPVENVSTATDFGRWCRMRIRKKFAGKE